MKKYISLLSGILISQAVLSQDIEVIFPGFTNEFYKEELGGIICMNHSAVQNGTVILLNIQQGPASVYSYQTLPFNFESGSTLFSFIQKKGGKEKSGNNDAGKYFSSTGQLPAGNYELSLTFLYAKSGEPLSPRFSTWLKVLPMLPVQLEYPANAEIIYTLQPDLSWIPPQPVDPDQLTYSLVIFQPADAGKTKSSKNHPYFFKSGITGNNLLYSFNDKPLEYHKTYSWQVTAYSEGKELSKSETWYFTPEPPGPHQLFQDPGEEEPIQIIYWQMDDHLDAGHYKAIHDLYIAFQNYSADSILSYTITDIGNPLSLIDSMPHVHIGGGSNYVKIPLQQTGLFTDQQYYRIEFTNGRQKKYKLVFQYLEN